jgi:hypothetical protein
MPWDFAHAITAVRFVRLDRFCSSGKSRNIVL